jgi:hypothetical protein
VRCQATNELGVQGGQSQLKALGYPQRDIHSTAIEKALLKYSNALRLEDDLTFLEMRFPSLPARVAPATSSPPPTDGTCLPDFS